MAQNVSKLKIKGSLDKVWAALTEPSLVKMWQYGSDLETTWQIGSPIRFSTRWQDTVFEQWGIVLEFKPKELIRYSLFAPRPDLEDKPENYFEMIYVISQNDGFVNLEIIQVDNRPGAVQEDQQGEGNPILAELKKVAER